MGNEAIDPRTHIHVPDRASFEIQRATWRSCQKYSLPASFAVARRPSNRGERRMVPRNTQRKATAAPNETQKLAYASYEGDGVETELAQ